MATTDLRSLPRNDLGVIGAGVLALIVSFLPYYGASSDLPGLGRFDANVNAWHGTALVGMLLVVAAAAVAAAQTFAAESLPRISLSWNLVVLGLSLAGALLIVIRSFTLPSGSGLGIDYGIRYGGWLLIICAIAQAVFAAMRFRATGESLPWQRPAVPPAA